jgi:hypothetical protein
VTEEQEAGDDAQHCVDRLSEPREPGHGNPPPWKVYGTPG